jgi:glycerophosphodiester phosphodiesterase
MAAPGAEGAHPSQVLGAEGAHPCSLPSGPFWARPRLCGHRGAGAETAACAAFGGTRAVHALENSLLSIGIAACAPGISFVEFDVQLSRDGVPVVHHDWCVRVNGAAAAGGAPVALRVPVGHLSAAQLVALAPQPMARGAAARRGGARGAEEVADEGAWAAAIDGGAPPPAAGARPPSTTAAAAARALAALGLDAPRRGAPPRARDGLGLRDGGRGFPTLASLLASASPALGFNVELKYPSREEAAAFGLRVPPPAEFAAAVWRVVAPAARGGRAVVFSSFDPDVALAARRLQARFPVLFLTMGGLERFGDERMNGLAQAEAWALRAGLDGVVAHARPLLGAGGGAGGGGGGGGATAAVAALREKGLLVGTFGGENNDPAAVAAQAAAGVNLIIVDAVKVAAPFA